MALESAAGLRFSMAIDIGLCCEKSYRPTGDPSSDEIRVIRPGIAHRDIGLALGQTEDLRRRIQLDLHIWMLIMQARHRRNDEVNGHRVGGADPYVTGQTVIQPVDVSLQFQRRMLHFFHTFTRRFTNGGQRITVGGTQEQRRAQCLLQRSNAPSDRGLIDAQNTRSPAQCRLATDRQKHSRIIPIHTDPL